MNLGMETATELPVGLTFAVAFPAFTPSISILSATKLAFEMLEGELAGTKGVADYSVINLRPGLFAVGWQEESRATVLQIQDFANGVVHRNLTTPDGNFVRMSGKIQSSHQD